MPAAEILPLTARKKARRMVPPFLGRALRFACVAFALSGGLVLGQIPQNGSFESDYAGWSNSGNQNIVTSPSYATDGTKAVALNAGQSTPNAILTQSFATTDGQTYTVSFDLGTDSWQSSAEQRLQVIVQGTGTLLSQTASVFAQGTGPHYGPRKNFTFSANSTTTTLTFQDVSQTTINVDVLLDNVQITVQNAPAITSQPQSVTAQAGDTVNFTVTATGQAPLQYQWRLNTVDIPGANLSSYTINNVQNDDAGNYDVVVSNGSGSVTSATAVLTILPAGILVNGSFEYDYSGWSGSGNQNIISSPSYVTDGAKAVAFNAGQSTPNAVLTQSFATVQGQTYVLAFDLGTDSYQSNAQQRLQVTVQGSAVTLLSETATISAQGTGPRYSARSYTFVADGETAILTFQDVSQTTVNVDVLLDNVRITEDQGTPTPTPTPGTLTNGSFEQDYLGWNASGNQEIAPSPPYQATDGTKAVIFNAAQSSPNAVLIQSFATTIGETYVLSFDLGTDSFQSNAEQRMEVTVEGATEVLSLTASVFAQGTGISYTPKSYTFVADSETTTLTLRDISATSTNVDMLLDNVTVTLEGGDPTPTPTPGSSIPANGSFESDYTSWSASGNQAVATNDPSHPASDGSKVVVFSVGNAFPNGVLSQTFPTTPGQRYGLALDLGTVGAIADQRMQVTVVGNGVLFDQVITVSSPDAGAFYVPQHISFVANSETTTLTFQDASITYYVIDFLLDNVEITPENAQAPSITSQPQRTAAATGRSATFSIAASGPGPLSYQWRFEGVDIGGANLSSYTISSVAANQAGNYDVIVSNTSGSVTSSAATLTVVPPAILLNGSFEYGSAAWTFVGAVATSTNAVNYGVTDGAQLTHFNFGQQSPDGVLTQTFETVEGEAYVLAFDVGAYSPSNQSEQKLEVVVQGDTNLISQTISVFPPGNGTRYLPQSFAFVANSPTTTLTFRDVSVFTNSVDLLLDNVRVSIQDAPAITSQPQSVTTQVGGNATFNVTATGQAPLSYQWRFNGADIGGANSSSYTISNVQNSDAGNYDVVVSNTSGSLTSSTAVLTVLPSGILANGSFEFDYSGWSGSGNQQIISSPSYATDGTKAVAFNSGQSTPNAVLVQSFATTAGQSYVLAFDLGTNSYQSSAQQRMQVSIQGDTPRLSEVASVLAQWTGPHYTPMSYTFVADSATTTLTLQDISQTTINVDILLDNVRITPQNAPAISSQPQSAATQVGGSVNFSVTATGQAPLQYQWRFNTVDIPGANSNSYAINNVQNSDAGNYDVVVSNGSGSVTSATAVLTVLPPGTPANGSFEYDYAAWSGTGNQRIVSSASYATDGVKGVAFNSGQSTPNAVLSQSFTTTTGQTYVLSFDLGTDSYQSSAQQRIQVSVQGSGVLLAPTIVSIFAQGTGQQYGPPRSFSFTADSDTTTLTFQDVSQATINVDLLLDNVQVIAQAQRSGGVAAKNAAIKTNRK